MASPQLENGYTSIANKTIEALARIRISGEEMQVLWVILRKTYGWHKKEDEIPLSQFALMTGVKKPNIIRAIKKLLSKKIIVIKNDNGNPLKYRFNKDFDAWKPLSKKITVIKKDNKSLSILLPSKETVQKKSTCTVVETQKRESYKEKIKEVIEFLNEGAGKNFQPTNQSTRDFITDRLNEGRTMEDFKLVIEYKCKEWLHDEKMLKYLRPSTLFRASNFENYLVEAERVRVEKSPKIRLDRETGKAYYCAPNIKLDKEPEKAYYNNPSLKDLTREEKERSEESRKRALGEWRRIKGTREIDKRELEKFSNRKLEEEGNNEENG